jgi:hypothetical protein
MAIEAWYCPGVMGLTRAAKLSWSRLKAVLPHKPHQAGLLKPHSAG